MASSIRTAPWVGYASGVLAALGLIALPGCGGGGGGGDGDGPPPPPTLTSISVTPATPTIALGNTHQFTATGTYSDGSTRVLTATAAWSSSNTLVATIASGGLATTVSAGSTTIGAASGTVTGSTNLTVTAAILSSITVTPTDPVLGYLGAIQQFRATGRYSDQSTRDLTNEVTWSSSDAAVATIGADGFARAAAISGSSMIRAQSGSVSASTTLALRTATVSGEIAFPDSDMGWKPSLYDYQTRDGGKVRVLGTGITVDVVPTSATTGTFSLAGVPWGTVTLLFEEGWYYDVFTQASKRVTVNVGSATVTGANFDVVYHWDELAGYPPAWNTMNSQGPVGWKAQFVSDQVAFVSFRRDVPNDRVELYRTIDRGASWTLVGHWPFDQAAWMAGTPYPVWTNFHFLDASHGVMHATTYGIPCDTGGFYFFTTDGGQHWSTAPLPLTPTGYHVETSAYARIGGSHLVMAGRVGCGVQGYTAGAYDAIWESTNAGATWVLKWYSPRDEWGPFIGVDANDAGRAVAYRDALSQQFVLRDAHGSWTTRPSGGIYSEGRDIAMVDDHAWMTSVSGSVPNGTYRSLDAGQTWSKVSDGLVQDFDFASVLKGFAQAGGPAYVTYDGGANWRYQSAGGAIWPGVMDVWAFDRTHAAWAEVGFGDPNGIGQLFTYVEPVQSSLEAQAHAPLTDASVARGATNVPLASYRLTSHGPTPISNGTFTLRASGSLNDATHVTAVRVWWDRDGDGAVDVDDMQLASGSFSTDDGTATLSLSGAGTLEQLNPVQLLVTCDLASATGYTGTFRVLLAAATVSGSESGGATVTATAPTDFVVAGRTITVTP
jgi:hypothetical protein